MKQIRKFLRNLKRKLIISTNKKIIVVFISLLSLIFTIFIVKFIKSYELNDKVDLSPYYYEALNDGKSAVSILLDVKDLPDALVYPGSKIDLLKKTNEEINFLVKDVFVVAMSYVQNGEKVKLDIALDEYQSKKVLSVRHELLRLLVKGDKSNNSSDLEIIEL